MDGQAGGNEYVNSAESEGLEHEMEQEGVSMTEGQMWRQLAAETKKRADALQGAPPKKKTKAQMKTSVRPPPASDVKHLPHKRPKLSAPTTQPQHHVKFVLERGLEARETGHASVLERRRGASKNDSGRD
jgi:hypothetical protein